MNKYQIKKMFVTLALSGTMVLATSCSKKDYTDQPLPSQKVEKEQPNATPMPTKSAEKPKKSKIQKKRDLINKIKQANFDPLVEDILKSIVKGSKKENSSVIQKIQMACSDVLTPEEKDSFIDCAIEEAAEKPKKESKYSIEDLKIFNNLNKRQKKLPKKILLMNHNSTYGKYRFYRTIDLNIVSTLSDYNDDQRVFVTNQQDQILLIKDFTKIGKVKDIHLQSFSKLLKAYGIKPNKKYTYRKLSKDITFRLSKRINGNKNNNSKKIATKDIIVVDTKKLESSENIDKRYYFLKYRYPYLFASKTDVYSDIFNPNAKVLINQDNALSYTDYHQKISMFDAEFFKLDDAGLACQSLNKFLRQKNIDHNEYISYEKLLKINKKFNTNYIKVKKKTKK